MLDDVSFRAGRTQLPVPDAEPAEAYWAIPEPPGAFPGVVILHHSHGWDRSSKEVARTFANRGFITLMPNLFHRQGPDLPVAQAAAQARAEGSPSDAEMLEDVSMSIAALRNLDTWNGRVAVVGYCSGGRQAYIAAARLPIDAAVVCYGRRIVAAGTELTPRRPVAPLDMTEDISCPILGIFGTDDENPSPAHRAIIAAELEKWGKTYDFVSYEGAGHAFFDVDRDKYSSASARDGWSRIIAFLEQHLGPQSPTRN